MSKPRSLDQTVEIETPEQVVFSYAVAGIGSRATAALIDHLLILFLLLFFAWLYFEVIGPYVNGPGAGVLLRRGGAWALAILALIQFIAQWGYYVLFEALWDGQTPGKRSLGLRVVRDGGYSVTWSAAAARNIARIIDMQPGLTCVTGMVLVALSRTGKRAGDHLAGTLVIREHVVTRPAPRAAETAADTDRVTARAPVEAVLTESELELLQRFLSRVDGLEPEQRERLMQQLAERFRSHLDNTRDPLEALRDLAAREQQARAQGAAGRGETGATRERWALIAEGEPRWARFAAWLAQVQRTGLKRMSAEEVSAFVAAYREIATDLARLSTATRGRENNATFRLNRLVATGHNLIYRSERMAGRAAARFLLRTVPAEVRRSALPILTAAMLLSGSGVATYVRVLRNPGITAELVPAGMIDRAEADAARARAGNASYIDVESYARPILSSAVLRNNVQVAFFAFASGLTAGILTVIILLVNGISIGAAFALFANHGVARLIADFVLPHSVFELSAICIAAGAGFVIAKALLLPGARTRRDALVEEGRRALRLLTAAALFLGFAGAIEGLISPRADIGFGARLGVALASALVIVLYLSLGRAPGDADPAEA